MAEQAQNYKVDPDNYMGFQHDEYKTKCYSLALSDPTKYYELRSTVFTAIKRNALKNLYKTFYDILSTGELDGADIIKNIVKVAPNYPNQKASKFALDACATLMPVIESVIEILLPIEGTETAQKRMAEVALGK
jgi:hypothetical protein